GILVGGQLRCWGNNSFGPLGDGTTVNRPVPTPVSGGGAWAEVSAGHVHTCAIRTDRTLWCWGENSRGRLGDGTNVASRLTPVREATASTWHQVSAGNHTCAISRSSTTPPGQFDERIMYCWGSNDAGELGDGTQGGQHNVPHPIGTPGEEGPLGITGWMAVSVGSLHSHGLRP